MTMCESFTTVLQHASASLTAEGRRSRVHPIHISVKCSPVGISNNTSRAPLLTYSLQSISRPPNLPLRAVPIPGNSFLFTATRDPDSDRSSRFGSCAIISRTCMRVTTQVSMAKEVTDCGSFQNKGPRDSGSPPYPNKRILYTSLNHGVYSKNFSGTRISPPIQMRRSPTR